MGYSVISSRNSSTSCYVRLFYSNANLTERCLEILVYSHFPRQRRNGWVLEYNISIWCSKYLQFFQRLSIPSVVFEVYHEGNLMYPDATRVSYSVCVCLCVLPIRVIQLVPSGVDTEAHFPLLYIPFSFPLRNVGDFLCAYKTGRRCGHRAHGGYDNQWDVYRDIVSYHVRGGQCFLLLLSK